MFCFERSFLIYFIIFLFFLLVVIYIWRRLNGIESYNKILENKVQSLKKENLELQKALSEESNEKISIDDAEVIMNEIFNGGTCDIITDTFSSDTKEVTKIEELKTNTVEILHSAEITDVVNENNDDKKDIPVVSHEISSNISIENDDLESNISEMHPNTYNRKKLTKLNLDKLKEIASSLDLSTEGTKNVIIDRILT